MNMASGIIKQLIKIRCVQHDTTDTTYQGEENIIEIPIIKLRIICGIGYFNNVSSTANEGALYRSDTFTHYYDAGSFNTFFGGVVSKGGFSSNVGIFGSSCSATSIIASFWRGVSFSNNVGNIQFICVGTYT